MISSCSLRRRISKKWLIVILVCCLIDSLVLLLYYHRTRPPSLHHVSHHQEVEIGDSSSSERKEESSRSPSPPSLSPPPPPPPSPRKEEAKDSKPKIDIEQNVNYVENILSKMEKSMEKDKQELDPKLPKPREMLTNLEGPVERLPARPRAGQTKSVKMLVVAREHSGFPVLAQFLSEENNFFVHGEPPGPTGPADLDTVPNLLNCVLGPGLVQNFSSLMRTEFGQSPYFRRHCLLGSGTVCSDPLSYETFCSGFPHQLIRAKHTSLQSAREIMRENPDISVVFLVRDPRGSLSHSSQAPAALCSDLARDWEEALRLVSDFPAQFSLARYETLAVAPQTEMDNLLKSLRLPTFLSAMKSEINNAEDDWNPKKNSIVRVNSWKTGLTNKELKSIENVCVETLSKMEYQLLSAP